MDGDTRGAPDCESAMTRNATCNDGCNGLSSRLQEKHSGKPNLQPGCNAACNDSAMLRPLYREGRIAGLQLQWKAKVIGGLTAGKARLALASTQPDLF